MGKLLSVVMPIYNETNIRSAAERVMNVLNGAGIEHEIILVDDGSTNDAWNQISDLTDEYSILIGIAFSRNFGKESALCAGLNAANGDCVVCIDSDMQHPPEVIPKMFALWEKGCEVVEGVKNKRQSENGFYRFCAGAFYSLLKKLSGIDLKNSSDFRLLDRSAVEAWKSMPEKQTFFRGMSSWVGFRRECVYFDVEERAEGSGKWSPRRLVALAVDAITSYTAFPLYISMLCGVLFLLFAVIMTVQTLCMKLMGAAQSGFTTVIVLQLFIGAVSMLSVGIVGIYIKKIYEEVKNRPRYIIRRIKKGKETKDNADA